MWTEIEHMRSLEYEVAHLMTLLQPTDTGHIHTAIGVLTNRIHEIGNKLDLESDDHRPKAQDRMCGGGS